jgi:hypothetical protein
MLHSFCVTLVKASAVVVCVGLVTSACVVRERTVVRGHPEYREEHHEEHHEEHRERR